MSKDTLNSGETKSEWREKLAAMTEDELYKHCEEYIWLSAYANNNPRSDYHFLADAGYEECHRREKMDLYKRAYNAARASAGY